MKPTVKIEGGEEINRALKEMGNDFRREFKQEVYAHGLDTQKEAKERLKDMQAWDLGNLANSIEVTLVDGGFAAEIAPESPYGVYVEYGTKPHFPPFKGEDAKGLEGWARRHGFDSVWPICLVIAKRGLPARPYLIPAWEKIKDKFYNKIKGIINR
jgi:hypothetical protein